MDAVGDMDRVLATDRTEHVERPGRFVRIGALQHQHGAAVGQAPNLCSQACGRRCMQIEGMVRRVPGDDRCLRARSDGTVDGRTEAAIGFRQGLGPEVEIGEVCDTHGVGPFHAVSLSSVSTLST